MISEKMPLPSKEEQRLGGDAIVRRYTLIAAGVGIIPSPVVNSVGIAVMELAMIDELAKNYKNPFPTKLAAAKAFISFVGSLGPVYLALKSKAAVSAVPLVGHLLSSTIYSVTGAISVYAVGRIFQLHFESDGTLLSKENNFLKKVFKREADQGAKEIPKLIATHS